MLDSSKYGKTAKLGKPLKANDTQLVLATGEGVKFKLDDQSHFYLTLRNGGTREVVKVVGRNGDTLNIVRGEDNTTAQTFPKESCLSVEWNPLQLCEFVKTCLQPCVNIKPQTVVVQCGTLIEVNECGNIVRLEGSSKC